MRELHDLTGCKFGKLTVIKKANSNRPYATWLCECDCGNKVIVEGKNLRNRHINNCGCLKEKHYEKHGKSGTRLYKVWHGMKGRCYSKGNSQYKNYGARGITICDEWLHDCNAFYNWAMANGYRDDLTIDRIDVNGNYEPSNCRWATQVEQANNKRNNHFITYKGQTKTLSQWSQEYNLSYNLLKARINRGWSIERAIEV